jgi:putative ABC transport system permease protein
MRRPPAGARMLLWLCLPARLRESIMGDLEEQWHARGGREYWRLSMRSILDCWRGALGTGMSDSDATHRGVWAAVGTDLRFAGRLMARNPGFALAAVLTLALGIGGSTAIFSTVNPTLFEPLPYPASDRLVSACDRGQNDTCLDVTFGTYRELLARTRAFQHLAVMRVWQPVLAEIGEAERLDGQRVTSDYFRVLGIPPAIGRDFTDADDVLNGPRVVILGDGIWRRRFGADPAVVGREIPLGSFRYLVIGVMPASFENVLAPSAEVWTPLQYDPALPTDGREWGHHLRLIGRVRDDLTLAAAAADVEAIAASPISEFARVPWASLQNGLIVTSMQDELTRGVRPVLLAFAAAVLLVLVIACANVANLLLARAVQRQREFAMRSALGAGRWRLVRQLLVEGLLIAVPGGLLGVIAAQVAVDALLVLAPIDLPRVDAVAVDARALAFAIGLTTVVGIAIAVLPAVQVFRRNLQASLQQNTRTAAGGHRTARHFLVVTEVALALVLLVSGGLLFRSLHQLVSISPGFESSQLVVAQVQVSGARFRDDGPSHRFFEQVLEATRRLPGVSAAAITSQLPLSGQVERFGVFLEQSPPLDPNADGSAYRYSVSPEYFQTMGIPVRRGRALEPRDREGAPFAVVISETLARRRFAGVDPIGQRMRMGPADGPWYTVVGVAADVKQSSLSANDAEAFYVTPTQWFFADPARWIVVRATAQQGLPAAIRGAVRSVDPGQPVVRLTSMDALLAAVTADRRFALTVFSAFGGIALVLAVTGLYGALARSVLERTREIGVRVALGASRGEIVAMVMRQGLGLTAIGIGLGVGGATTVTRLLETLLFGTTSLDPATYVSVVALFTVVAALASVVPAARAVSIDPAITLRAE